MNNGLAFTICPAEEDITSLTLDPEPSQPPPTPCIKPLPDPTADTEFEPAAMLTPETTPEPICPGGKAQKKVWQVCELAGYIVCPSGCVSGVLRNGMEPHPHSRG